MTKHWFFILISLGARVTWDERVARETYKNIDLDILGGSGTIMVNKQDVRFSFSLDFAHNVSQNL